MALQLEQWFIHALNDNAILLSQQTERVTDGATMVQEGVVGKTYPFNTIASIEMVDINGRDGTTQYLNPTMAKRRANLLDKAAALLIDDFDTLKTLVNPTSPFMQELMAARARQMDRFLLSVAGLGTAGATGTAVGGILGLAPTVDEGAESVSNTALPTAQQIVDGGTNLTMAKIIAAKTLMDNAAVKANDRYFFYSPDTMKKLLTDTQVTSSDYSSIQALTRGGFGMNDTWVGFKWRSTILLPKTGNIRQCIAVQKNAVGLAIGLFSEPRVTENAERWNNQQIVLKLSAGAVRIDDSGVVQVNCDETA